MNDHEIGAALRERLLRDQQQGGSPDGRRLQALVGDLCGDDPRLLPAMRYLVNWEPFLRELARRPPLADPRLALRIRQELREIFAMPVCERMDTVVNGLLAVPESAPAPRPRRNARPQRELTPQTEFTAPAAAEPGRGKLASVLLLCLGAFLGGGVLALVVGVVLPGGRVPVEPQPARQDLPQAHTGQPGLQAPRAA